MIDQPEKDDDVPRGYLQGVQGTDGPPITQNSADLTLLLRMVNNPAWRLPAEAYEKVPQEMLAIITDPRKSSRAKSTAAKVLAQLNQHNHRQTLDTLNYLARTPQGGRWEPPGRHPDDVNAVAFLEATSSDDLRETAKVLSDLGILERLADAEPDSNASPADTDVPTQPPPPTNGESKNDDE